MMRVFTVLLRERKGWPAPRGEWSRGPAGLGVGLAGGAVPGAALLLLAVAVFPRLSSGGGAAEVAAVAGAALPGGAVGGGLAGVAGGETLVAGDEPIEEAH